MKFKVGDRVRIRKDLKEGYDLTIYVSDEMGKYAGNIVTISKTRRRHDGTEIYEIKEDDGYWAWSEDMFEQNKKPSKEELFDMPIGTIIKTDREENNVYIKVGENDFCNDNCDHIEDSDINEDLTVDNYCGDKTIIEIQIPTYETIYTADTEIKEMTIAEIEKQLGYPIKIVKEEE